MNVYKVTIHEHKIYETYISAPSQQLAIESGEEQIISEDNLKWREDVNAGWTDVIDAELVDDVVLEDEEM